MMRRCYVALGSNIDAARHIVGSVAELRDRFGKVTLSTVYESEAAGFAGEPFLNAVAAFDSTASPDRLSGILRAIEIAHHRNRQAPKFSARTLDLDLILHDNTVINTPTIRLPHPDIERYWFVLKPLIELAPEAKHPVTQRTYKALWPSCDHPPTADIRTVSLPI